MNSKKVKRIRKEAQELSVGMKARIYTRAKPTQLCRNPPIFLDVSCTRKIYKDLKRKANKK